MGCMLSAASCNKWWNEEILKTKDFAAEQAGITKLGENRVFYPISDGERSPHNNPDARAMFIGMSMDTTREDMTLVIEGEVLDVLVGSRPLVEEEKEEEKKEKDLVKAMILRYLKDNYDMEEEDFLSAELEVVPAGKARLRT